jgi:hypothetical protein
MSQTTTIAKILVREGKIDNYRCMRERISNRLAARIQDLKGKGYKVRTEELPDKNFVYHLVATPEPKQEALIAPFWG